MKEEKTGMGKGHIYLGNDQDMSQKQLNCFLFMWLYFVKTEVADDSSNATIKRHRLGFSCSNILHGIFP